MYSVCGYGQMIADRTRLDAYMRAMQDVVKPGMTVVDIGTGVGIFAMIACRLGARRVYAVEPADIISVARQLAAENGFADRIEFIQATSTDVNLPEAADVIVSDLRSVLPPFQRHFPSIIDARHRFLSRDGQLLPRRDTMWVAVVEAPELHRECVGAWSSDVAGLTLEAARRLAVNRWRKARIAKDQLLTAPQQWTLIDYSATETADIAGTFSGTTHRAGVGHGLCVWFEAALTETVGFSNAPGSQLIYGQAFFPWPSELVMAPGDAIQGRLSADLVGDDYVWRWQTIVTAAQQELARFDQSTFFGLPLAPSALRRAAVSKSLTESHA